MAQQWSERAPKRLRGRTNLNAKEVEELFEIEFLSEDEFSSDNESPLLLQAYKTRKLLN